MTRLIDADALSEKLCETTIFIKDGEVFQRMINDAPTVDAVEVVRCKDCKYHTNAWNTSNKSCCGYCTKLGAVAYYGVDAMDYCSFAERREP